MTRLSCACCRCGLSCWAEGIAWIQIVLNAVALFGSVISVTTLGIIFGTMDEKQEEWAEKNFFYDTFANVDVSESSFMIYVVCFVTIFAFTLLLISFVLGIVYGIILLQGATERKLSHLRRWMDYIKFYFISHVLFSLAVMYVRQWSLIVVVPLCVYLAVLSSFILLIYIFRNGIRNEAEGNTNELELR